MKPKLGYSRFSGTAMVACVALLAGCANPVKVRESWKSSVTKQKLDLSVARESWISLKQGKISSFDDVDGYNLIVRDSVVQIAENWSADKSTVSTLNTVSGNVTVDVDASSIRRVEDIDHLIPADFIKIKRGLKEKTIIEGIGSSMVIRREHTEEDPLVPKKGLWSPVTVIMDFDRPDRPVLRFVEPDRNGEVSISGHSYPLAANYSAFLARDFEDRQRQIIDLPALLNYNKFEDQMGIYRMSAFDPGKKVCILIHGINSSPATWRVCLNGLYADREIREKYEFWVYGYPTGAPIPYLSLKLREAVEEMTEYRRNNGARNLNITVLGHSMGGLMAKALTQHSGRENWDAFFKVPPSELNLPDDQKELLEKMMFFEPNPYVDTVIFAATPHQGSDLAEKSIIQVISGLVDIPGQILFLSKDMIRQSQQFLTPLGQDVARELPTSLGHLGPSSVLSSVVAQIPLNPNVRYYSVIGNNSPEGTPLEKSSDNVVPYVSSHIEGVEWEKVVRSKHGVQYDEEGIAALIRALKDGY